MGDSFNSERVKISREVSGYKKLQKRSALMNPSDAVFRDAFRPISESLKGAFFE